MNETIISSGLKIIIIPGNGNTDVYKNNWYQWVKKELEKKGYGVICQNMPDPDLASGRKSWF